LKGARHKAAIVQHKIAPRHEFTPTTMGYSMMRVRIAICTALALCFAMPALAATSTPYAMGGKTREFAVDVQKYRQSGEQFRITGHCQSACTMFLSLRNVCIEPSARLLFHAGQTPEGTSRMMNSYNGKLRSYLTARRIMESPQFHTISGRDMINRFGYRACPGGG
jgi:hypothetical protein